MNSNIFSGLPEYVRITILSQIRRLLSTPLFSYEDREDICRYQWLDFQYRQNPLLLVLR